MCGKLMTAFLRNTFFGFVDNGLHEKLDAFDFKAVFDLHSS